MGKEGFVPEIIFFKLNGWSLFLHCRSGFLSKSDLGTKFAVNLQHSEATWPLTGDILLKKENALVFHSKLEEPIELEYHCHLKFKARILKKM